MVEHVEHTPGYHDQKEQVLARLKRIEGQVRGIERMVDNDTYCIDVLTQVSAATKALAGKGYEGWFVVEAEQDPKVSPPLEMAQKGHKELLRVMAAAGYEVVQ